MTARRVLDAWGLIAYFENETAGARVAGMIRESRDRGVPLLLCVVNLGEVYYITRREAGKDAAERVLAQIGTLPIEVVPADRELTLAAAELKSQHKMSYADCFAAALALSRKARLATGDKEFKALEDRLHIDWLTSP